MVEIKKIEVDGDVIYLSKQDKPWLSKWHVVHPIKNEDGSYNWKNFIAGGNYWNLVFVLLFVLVFMGAVWEYNDSLKECAVAMQKLNAYETIVNPVGLNPITDNLRLIPNITSEVNVTE